MIKLNVLEKKFKNNNHFHAVLKDIAVTIPRGAFFGIYGPNGCGKTTLLRIISNLDDDYIGKAIIPKDINPFGFVFQNYAESLYPWHDNLDNISFYEKLRGVNRKQRKINIEEFLNKYDLEIDLHAYPNQQSGGQKQLVALLRAMIYYPEMLIMDEPFSSLDESLRLKMISVIQNYWKDNKSTIIFVSHDLEEVLLLSDELLIMQKLDDFSKSSILNSCEVPFARPRGIKLKESKQFFEFKASISRDIRKCYQE